MYSLLNLTPDVLEDLVVEVSSPDGALKFFDQLRCFMVGGSGSAADRDLAFSISSELSAFGIFDLLPIEQLARIVASGQREKVVGFRGGLPGSINQRIDQFRRGKEAVHAPEAPSSPSAENALTGFSSSKRRKTLKARIASINEVFVSSGFKAEGADHDRILQIVKDLEEELTKPSRVKYFTTKVRRGAVTGKFAGVADEGVKPTKKKGNVEFQIPSGGRSAHAKGGKQTRSK